MSAMLIIKFSGIIDVLAGKPKYTFVICSGYGVARAGALGFNELRNAVFAKESQNLFNI